MGIEVSHKSDNTSDMKISHSEKIRSLVWRLGHLEYFSSPCLEWRLYYLDAWGSICVLPRYGPWPMGVYNSLAALVVDIAASFVVGNLQVFVMPQCCAVHLKS